MSKNNFLVKVVVQGDSNFTSLTRNPIKKLVKIMKRQGYIPLILGFKCV